MTTEPEAAAEAAAAHATTPEAASGAVAEPESATAPGAVAVPRPGWYRDAYGGPGLRWWDGARWSHHVRPPVPPPPAHAGHNERVGRWTVLAQAVLSVVTTAAYGYAFARFLRDLGPYLDRLAAAEPGVLPEPPGSFALVAAVSLVGLLGWVPLLLELIWAYRAASAAAALGIPARREPVWALVSWFIPVIDWWFPYQSVRDCLPPGHPHRRTVARWWAGHLAGGTGALAGVGAALVGTVALVVVVAVYAVVAAVTAATGLRMVRAIDAAHRDLIGGTPVAGDGR